MSSYTAREKLDLPTKSQPGERKQFSSKPQPEDFMILDPLKFTRLKKWTITTVVSMFAMMVASSGTSFPMGTPSMIRDLSCTSIDAALGLGLFCLGFGILPLFTTAFSEEFGRLPLYYVSMAVFLAMHLVPALSSNIIGILASRFIQGAAGSTGIVTAAGTIADIWHASERGPAMLFFSWIAFTGNGLGALVAGWIETQQSLEWRWIQWVHLIIEVPCFILLVFTVEETRIAVRIAKATQLCLAKQLQDTRLCPQSTFWQLFKSRTSSAISSDQEKDLPSESGSASQLSTVTKTSPSERWRRLRKMIWLSFTRPIVFLFMEPIVFFVSLWIGLTWGVYYSMIQCIPGILRNLYGYNQGQIGCVYVTMIVGAVLGAVTNPIQERLYQNYHTTKGPQARLFVSCIASLVFPISMCIFALCIKDGVFTAPPVRGEERGSIPALIGLLIALTIYIWSVFIIYLAVFNYLADCYGTYASSALAGQGLFRNITATFMPLIAEPVIFPRLGGYRRSIFLFAGLALALSWVPFVRHFNASLEEALTISINPRSYIISGIVYWPRAGALLPLLGRLGLIVKTPRQ
ncbi:major facilitator superfamily domain-containing protein [Panaeolus papilionaceus]|nr:major facilitator superfamily domain-containing protein [Panaeolus papilionaceus]